MVRIFDKVTICATPFVLSVGAPLGLFLSLGHHQARKLVYVIFPLCYKPSDANSSKLLSVGDSEMAEPLITFVKARLTESDLRRIRYVTLNIRTPRWMQPGVYDGHSHGGLVVTWVKTEKGPSSRYQRDGLGIYQNPDQLVSVPQDHTIRFTYTWHAEPKLMEGEERLVVILSAED